MDVTGISSVTQALWEAEVDYRRDRAATEWRTAARPRRRPRRLRVPVGRTLRLPGRGRVLAAG
jgi:hypothetical protein